MKGSQCVFLASVLGSAGVNTNTGENAALIVFRKDGIGTVLNEIVQFFPLWWTEIVCTAAAILCTGGMILLVSKQKKGKHLFTIHKK